MAPDPFETAIRDSLNGIVDGRTAAVEGRVESVWRRIQDRRVLIAPSRHNGAARHWVRSLVAASVACLVLVFALTAGQPRVADNYCPAKAPRATAADYAEAARASSSSASLPAPLRPVPGFTVAADPSPASVGQTLEIRSAEAWSGKRVWLYVAPGSEQYIVVCLHKLPRDAMLIGNADISQSDGTWRLSWALPDRLERDGIVLDFRAETICNLIAVNEEGHLAFAGLQLAPQRAISISPQPAGAGDVIRISGADYPPNTRVRIDVLHSSPESGTDLQANLGWVTTGSDGTFDFSYRLPDRWNWPFSDSTGTMHDHWLTVGSAGTYQILTVEQTDQGPGTAKMKLMSIRN